MLESIFGDVPDCNRQGFARQSNAGLGVAGTRNFERGESPDQCGSDLCERRPSLHHRQFSVRKLSQPHEQPVESLSIGEDILKETSPVRFRHGRLCVILQQKLGSTLIAVSGDFSS